MKKAFLLSLIAFCVIVQSSFAVSSRVARVEGLFLQEQYDAVITEASAYIRSGSAQKDELYYLKGLSELKMKRFDDARSSFNTIIEYFPRSKKIFDAYLGLGDTHFLEGDAGKALGSYNIMVAKFPSDRNISIVHSRMSACYAKMGLHDKADTYSAMTKQAAPLSFEAKTAVVAPAPVQSAPRRNVAPQQTVHITGQNALIVPSSAGDGKISIQVGSFKSKRNADKLVKKLASQGYKSFVAIPVNEDDKFYRVKVGKLSSKEEASKLAARLKEDGYRTSICTGDVCE